MFDKAFDFLVRVAVSGFLAVFISIGFYVVLAIVFFFAMIPVSIITGNEGASKIMNFAGDGLGYKIIYAIVFISTVMNDFGVPSIKTVFGRWRHSIKTVFNQRRQKKNS